MKAIINISANHYFYLFDLFLKVNNILFLDNLTNLLDIELLKF